MYKTYIVLNEITAHQPKAIQEARFKRFNNHQEVFNLFEEATGFFEYENIIRLEEFINKLNDDDFNPKQYWCTEVLIKTNPIVVTKEKIDDAKEMLELAGYVATYWNLNDIKCQAKEIEVEITEEQALLVVYYLIDHHDGNYGIDYQTISNAINEIVENSKKPMWETKDGRTNIRMPDGKLVTVSEDFDQQIKEVRGFLDACDTAKDKKYYSTLLERMTAFKTSLK